MANIDLQQGLAALRWSATSDQEWSARITPPQARALLEVIDSKLFADAGLIVEHAYDGFTDRPLKRTSSEMLLVARKE